MEELIMNKEAESSQLVGQAKQILRVLEQRKDKDSLNEIFNLAHEIIWALTIVLATEEDPLVKREKAAAWLEKIKSWAKEDEQQKSS